MACVIDESQLPILTGCPGDGELFMVGNAVGGLDANGGFTTGYARRSWASIRQCLATKFFGDGIKTITGLQLDGSNRFIDANMSTSLVVFYNGVSRYLVRGSEWDYVANGIQILIPGTFGSQDFFIIFPNPF